MFQGQGDYYCINGCFSYPIKINKIKDFIKLSEINNVDQVICYQVHPSCFSFKQAMENKYKVIKMDLSLMDENTLLSLDFFYLGLSCQMQVEFFDEYYFGISLVHSIEDQISKEKHLKLKESFYSLLDPIYGNDGYEKWLLSLKDIQKDDFSMFDNNFYINKELYHKMNINCFDIKNDIILMNGLYYLRQSKKIYETIYNHFYKVIKSMVK